MGCCASTGNGTVTEDRGQAKDRKKDRKVTELGEDLNIANVDEESKQADVAKSTTSPSFSTRVAFYELGTSQMYDDWFVAFNKVASSQPATFKRLVVDAAPNAAREAIAERSSAAAAAAANNSGDENNNRTVSYTGSEEDFWRRYGFANLPKDGLASLDATFMALTKQRDDLTGPAAIAALRKKLVNNIAERDEYFFHLITTLALCGRDAEFRQLSPSRVRQNFRIDEWSMDIGTWRAGWLGLEVYSWKQAKAKVKQLNAEFDALQLDSEKLILCTRFAFLFSKKDSTTGALEKNLAVNIWQALYGKKWDMISLWTDFIENHWDRSTISNDQWDQLPLFAARFPTLKVLVVEFDPATSFWPSLMDGFVRFVAPPAKAAQSCEGSMAGKDRGISSCNDEGESCYDEDEKRSMY